nr:MAG TPA_asm: hypothetical protein [Bacteriophage sp.]DAM66229.1 MAG TPA: hypothetical protein [Caudoviricetes sp.]
MFLTSSLMYVSGNFINALPLERYITKNVSF